MLPALDLEDDDAMPVVKQENPLERIAKAKADVRMEKLKLLQDDMACKTDIETFIGSRSGRITFVCLVDVGASKVGIQKMMLSQLKNADRRWHHGTHQVANHCSFRAKCADLVTNGVAIEC